MLDFKSACGYRYYGAQWNFLEAVFDEGQRLGKEGGPVPSDEEVLNALAELIKNSPYGKKTCLGLFRIAFASGQDPWGILQERSHIREGGCDD
jgi:hypothetical protein